MVGLALLPVSAANTPSLAVCLDPLCLASSQTPSPFPSFRDACTHAPTFDCCSNPDRPSRIINVSSAAHYFGSIDFSDLQSSKNYQPWKAYGQAKLANVLHTYELARQLEPTANCTGMATPLGTTLPCPPCRDAIRSAALCTSLLALSSTLSHTRSCPAPAPFLAPRHPCCSQHAAPRRRQH